jgi:hypothetical protein
VIGWLYDKRADRTANPEFTKRMGVLMATGLIVGESLFSVLFAGVVYGTGSGTPFALVGDSFAPFALVGGTIAFLAVLGFLYRRTMRLAA